jgi:hypothetical protein
MAPGLAAGAIRKLFCRQNNLAAVRPGKESESLAGTGDSLGKPVSPERKTVCKLLNQEKLLNP